MNDLRVIWISERGNFKNLIWESGFSYLEILFKLFWYLVLFPPFMPFLLASATLPSLTYFDLLWRIVTEVYWLPHCQQTFYTSAVTPKFNIQMHIFFKWPHFLLKGHTFRPSTCTLYYIETTFVILDGVHASVIRCISSML